MNIANFAPLVRRENCYLAQPGSHMNMEIAGFPTSTPNYSDHRRDHPLYQWETPTDSDNSWNKREIIGNRQPKTNIIHLGLTTFEGRLPSIQTMASQNQQNFCCFDKSNLAKFFQDGPYISWDSGAFEPSCKQYRSSRGQNSEVSLIASEKHQVLYRFDISNSCEFFQSCELHAENWNHGLKDLICWNGHLLNF